MRHVRNGKTPNAGGIIRLSRVPAGVEQPQPGVIRWTLPSGRIHTTKPTVYEFSSP